MGVAVVIEVLLAVYQGERVLPGLLQSLEAQTEKTRILYQDDGSTDASLSLLQPYTRIELPHAKGPKGNFMSLLSASREAYAMFCDQDDLWQPDKAEKTLLKMREGEAQWGRETPLLVHTDLRVTDGEGRTLYPSLFAHQHWDSRANTLGRLLVQNNVTGCTVMVNRPLRQLLLRAAPEKMFMHDWWAALTAAAFGHILFVGEPTIAYCQHGENQVGASRDSLAARAARALGAWEKGRERVALTYRQAQAFYDCYAGMLPGEAERCIKSFLKIPQKGKFRRIHALRAGGYTMQSPVTRMGHYLFC